MSLRPQFNGVLLVLGVLAIAGCSAEKAEEPEPDASLPPADVEVVVYASRNAGAVTAVLETWRAETGGRFRLLTDEMPDGSVRSGTLAIKPETDLLLASNLTEIWAVAESDELRPVFSDAVSNNVAPALRDPESRWTALSRRARVVVYNTDLVEAAELGGVTAYASLGDEKWQGRLCISSSAVPGNRALVAFLVSRHGAREAEIIVREWRANLATSIFVSDGALLDAVADGGCGIGFVDSAVLASYLVGNRDATVAAHWFADSANTFTDISAAAVTRHAKQADAAEALLAWLTGAAQNALFAGRRFEFPVHTNTEVASALEGWADRMPADAAYAELGFLLEEARLLTERARYP
jgi:iron(III) transport system substrate-binding protein